MKIATALLTLSLLAPMPALASYNPTPTPTPSPTHHFEHKINTDGVVRGPGVVPSAIHCSNSSILTAIGTDPNVVADSKCCIDVNQARGVIYKSQDSCGKKTPLTLGFFLICKDEMLAGQKLAADMIFPDKVCPTLFKVGLFSKISTWLWSLSPLALAALGLGIASLLAIFGWRKRR